MLKKGRSNVVFSLHRYFAQPVDVIARLCGVGAANIRRYTGESSSQGEQQSLPRGGRQGKAPSSDAGTDTLRTLPLTRRHCKGHNKCLRLLLWADAERPGAMRSLWELLARVA